MTSNVTASIHLYGPIESLNKLATIGCFGGHVISLSIVEGSTIYFDSPDQIPQLITQLAELHVMAQKLPKQTSDNNPAPDTIPCAPEGKA